uniref:Protein LTV1 n=1 Tax=Tetraselmis sp. GSL018 TaxID=582737 RepID=A0A061QKM3_9CHLO
MPGSSGDPEKDEEVEARELTKRLVSAYDEEGEPPAGSVETMVVEEPPVEKWDCESILSLRSNLDNHPRCISEPRRGGRPFPAGREKIELSAKTGLPINRQSGGATAMSSDGSSGDAVSIATSSVRRKDESREEKKARKAAVKEAQRQARARKKDLKQMFKDQESKMKGIQETRPTVPLP